MTRNRGIQRGEEGWRPEGRQEEGMMLLLRVIPFSLRQHFDGAA